MTNIKSECCNIPLESNWRFCPSCGWECRINKTCSKEDWNKFVKKVSEEGWNFNLVEKNINKK